MSVALSDAVWVKCILLMSALSRPRCSGPSAALVGCENAVEGGSARRRCRIEPWLCREELYLWQLARPRAPEALPGASSSCQGRPGSRPLPLLDRGRAGCRWARPSC